MFSRPVNFLKIILSITKSWQLPAWQDRPARAKAYLAGPGPDSPLPQY